MYVNSSRCGLEKRRMHAALILLMGLYVCAHADEPTSVEAPAPAASATAEASERPSAREIIQRADRARGSFRDMTREVTVITQEHGREDKVVFTLNSRGFDLLTIFTEPPFQRDARLLSVDGKMWFAKPGVGAPVPISRRQMMGKAAYGDLASTRYADEYDATFLPDEEVDGDSCYVFDLKSSSPNTSYDRIRYWVSKEKGYAVKSQFFTFSGKPIRTANMEYEFELPDGQGGTRPLISRMVVKDEMIGAGATTMTYGPPVQNTLSDEMFSLDALRAFAKAHAREGTPGFPGMGMSMMPMMPNAPEMSGRRPGRMTGGVPPGMPPLPMAGGAGQQPLPFGGGMNSVMKPRPLVFHEPATVEPDSDQAPTNKPPVGESDPGSL